MKNYFLLAGISIFCSMATFFAFQKWTTSSNPLESKSTTSIPIYPVNYGYAFPKSGMEDFTYAAYVATPAVVHIKSTKTMQPTAHFYNDPFKDFFEEFNFGFPQGPHKSESSGSGVIITSDGYIVTNNHVVDGADELSVTMADNTQVTAKVIGTDANTDLAVIKIDNSGLPYIPIANSDSVKIGQWVLAVGNPFDLESTVTAGIVSAKGRSIDILRSKTGNPIESFIQTDAAVNPGNSGGALVNLRGELIGINTAIASPTGTYAGYAFAVPANIVEKVVDDIIKYGIVQRAFLGVNISEMNDKIMKEKGLNNVKGIYVAGVTAGSGAEAAGLQEGDIITDINGVKVTTKPQMLEQIAKFRPGNKVAIGYQRNGKIYNTVVTLKNIENNTDIVKKDTQSLFAKLGAEFTPLDKQTLNQLGIENGVEVTNLSDGILSSSTGIREGFIIMKIDNTIIKTKEDIKKALEKKKGEVYMSGIYPDYPKMVYYRFEIN